jgi:hypothetical protein
MQKHNRVKSLVEGVAICQFYVEFKVSLSKAKCA